NPGPSSADRSCPASRTVCSPQPTCAKNPPSRPRQILHLRSTPMVGTPRLLLDNLVFAEGPRWHDGRLWFSDIHAFEVVAVDLEGRRETILSVPARPSGLGFLPDGRLLVIGMGDRRLLRLDPGGAVLHADISGLAAFCNDMVVDGRGNAYID